MTLHFPQLQNCGRPKAGLLRGFFCLTVVLASALCAGQTTQPQSAPSAAAAPENKDRPEIDATLQRYLAAYQHKSIQQLLEVWPDLEKQKKEYGKIKHHLGDASISDEQMTVQPQQIESNADGALVHAQRTEQFVKTETTSTINHGDLNMGATPVQDPGPTKSDTKKTSKKTDEVWIKLHHEGSNWTIVSITEQKP